MDSDPNGGPSHILAEERLNVFALVIYIPDPLGGSLDDLRRELVPHYNPHAHVSVLPPRPLAGDWQTASRQARALTLAWTPFDVELTELQMFPFTEVLYLEVGAGGSELRRMHSAMNSAALEFAEPYPYHPHVTLAQEVPHEDVPAVRELACRRWAEYRGNRTFRAECAVFVQATQDNCWIDLEEYPLGPVPVK
jgi:2'-5' RNA ligase